MSDYRWGRRSGNRIQHAWEPWTNRTDLLYPVCDGVFPRTPDAIDFDSDAARCERCAARLKRLEAE